LGKGGRQTGFGALHLAQADGNDGLKYIGRVGTGFDERSLKAVWQELARLTKVKKPIKEKPLTPETVWVEPKLMCEVAFASMTQAGMLREPVFLRLRPDLALNYGS